MEGDFEFRLTDENHSHDKNSSRLSHKFDDEIHFTIYNAAVIHEA